MARISNIDLLVNEAHYRHLRWRANRSDVTAWLFFEKLLERSFPTLKTAGGSHPVYWEILLSKKKCSRDNPLGILLTRFKFCLQFSKSLTDNRSKIRRHNSTVLKVMPCWVGIYACARLFDFSRFQKYNWFATANTVRQWDFCMNRLAKNEGICVQISRHDSAPSHDPFIIYNFLPKMQEIPSNNH